MAVYWNSRTVLAVDPKENQCVGSAISKGRRCKNPLSASNRTRANHLLDLMNEQFTQERGIRRHVFEQLADAMLCIGKHNCKSRPRLSQVDRVCEDWQDMYRDHVNKLQRKQSVRRSVRVKTIRGKDLQAVNVPTTEIRFKVSVYFPPGIDRD